MEYSGFGVRIPITPVRTFDSTIPPTRDRAIHATFAEREEEAWLAFLEALNAYIERNYPSE